MKPASTLFLKAVVMSIGIAVVAVCAFVLPQYIGTFELGGYDPILLGMYVPAIPFLFALYQALILLGYIDDSEAFSNASVTAIKKIKYCAIIISILYSVGMPYIWYVAQKDDAPGVAALGFVVIGASIVVATFAAVLQKLLREALEIKTENDLTV